MNQNRIEKVVQNMQAQGLDQILVCAPTSVYYLTGARVQPGERMLALYLNASGDMRLYANRLFALAGATDVPLIEFDDTDDCIAILSDGVRAGKLGIDKRWPSEFTIRLMDARGDLRPTLGSKPVDDARMIKDENELACMRESSLKNDEATRRTIQALREGMTEKDVARLYEQFSAELGSTAPSFPPLICFGANCAEPHHDTDDTRLRRGDSVILDVGLTWRDFCSDMTRTVFFGSATDEQKKVYDLVRRANAAGRAAAKPGVPLREIDRAARKLIEDEGYGPQFIHRLGHGIGLEVHEYPDCSATSEVVAKPGMVFSIEPGVYLKRNFGVRVEDLIAITEDGCETLNRLERDLLEL